jgi:hypothetical protein
LLNGGFQFFALQVLQVLQVLQMRWQSHWMDGAYYIIVYKLYNYHYHCF